MRIDLRLALLALLSALLVALVACGGDDGDGAAEGEDARALLGRALAKPVESGEMRLRIGLNLKGTNGLDGPSALTVRGPFEFRGRSALPTADWDVTASTGALVLRGGLKLTGGGAFLEFEGDAYELGELKSELPRARKEGFLKEIGLDPASWLESPRLEDGRDIGGDPTRRVTGSVDVEKVVRDSLAALRSPEFRRMLGPRAERLSPPELSDEEIDGVRDAISKLDFEAAVDDDDLLRRVLVKASFEVPRDAGLGDLEGGDVTIDYVLEKVGADVDVERPLNAQPIVELLREFGVKDPFGLTERQ